MVDLAERRTLAAMVMADVVGYSRLMGADETSTVRRLKDYRSNCVDPIVRFHRGRVIDAVGDSMFLEFASIVDATRCAIALQQAVAERNTDVPEQKRIVYRMGVNIGDVIMRDRSLFGDSVNIAARLQTLAEPGGICLSGAAFEQIRQKVEAEFAPLGAHQVKNIARPIEVFALSADAIGRMPKQEGPVRSALLPKRLALGIGMIAFAVFVVGGGAYLWKRLARQDLIAGLDSVLTTGQANLNDRSRARLIEQYLALGQHRALAIAPRAQSRGYTGDWPSAAVAEEKVLERCQLHFGEPCVLVAEDNMLLPRPQAGVAAEHDMPRLQYAGDFDPAKIPAVRQIVTERADVVGYGQAQEPKAAALHPGARVFTIVTGAITQRRAEIQALKACNEESTRESDGDCFLYAIGNKVVLPMRRTSSVSRP